MLCGVLTKEIQLVSSTLEMERREHGIKKVFKEIVSGNLPNLARDANH